MTNRFLTAAALLLLSLTLPRAGAADPCLAGIFSDHMVLQRETPVPVWGWADPGVQVTVEFAGQRKTTSADASGAWKVILDPLTASSESRSLKLSSLGKKDVTVSDVLVGEVWLGSGQSNMAFKVNSVKDAAAEKAAATKPLIRIFTSNAKPAPTPGRDAAGSWVVCSPSTVGEFSAVLYFFGRDLLERLNVPVGLINSSVGGTHIQSWIAEDVQLADPVTKTTAENLRRAYQDYDPVKATAAYNEKMALWTNQVAQATAAGKPAPRKPWDERMMHDLAGGPGELFNGRIHPLIPYALRGCLWYQGEANACSAVFPIYSHQLPMLVKDWRARWGEDLPFGIVQLPNYKSVDGWMVVREAQLKTLELPATGLAVTTDVGERDNIHPLNKQEVAHRLSLWALGAVYGQRVPAEGSPLPRGQEVKEGTIVCSFTQAAGLKSSDGGELKGFAIAGEDKQWKQGHAVISGEQVIVSSPDVSRPVAVRYNWATYPDGNLVNGAGLPASQFRNDDWDPKQAPPDSATPSPSPMPSIQSSK